MQFTSQAEREKYITDNIGLVCNIVETRFSGYCKDNKDVFEDFIQEGLIALIKAVDNFDENSGKFSCFAYKYIYCSLQTYINRKLDIIRAKRDKNKKYQHVSCVSFYDILPKETDNRNKESDNTNNIISQYQDNVNDDTFKNVESDIMIENFIKRATKGERNQEILRLYLSEQYTQGEIAKRFNISRQAVSEIIKKAKNKGKELYPIESFVN